MVTERLLVNIRYSFGPRGHSNMRMDGKCVGRGIIYNFQEKQGLKYCDLPLHLSILTATFNISIVYLKVKPSTLLIHIKQCLVQLFLLISAVQYLQYNICSTISAVQYLQCNICSTIFLQSTHYPGDLVLTHKGVKKNLYISLHQYMQDVYLVCLS